MILELDEVQERLLQLTSERETIMNEIEVTTKQKLKDLPVINIKIDNRETLLKSVELYSTDPSCQETITLELIQTNWGDNKPKEKVMIVTSKVFTPSTGQMERVYDFSVGGVRGSHNTHNFTNETFKSIHRSIQNYQVKK